MSFPTVDVLPRDDDFDYAVELSEMSLQQFAFNPSAVGQWTPVWKLIYGFASRVSSWNVPLQWCAFVIRLAAIGLVLLMLRRLEMWTWGGAVVMIAASVAYVGMLDVFFWPLVGALDLAFLLSAISILVLVENRWRRSWRAGVLLAVLLVGGGLTAATNLVVPFGLLLALFIVTWGRWREVRTTLLAIGLSGTVLLVCFVYLAMAGEHVPSIVLTDVPKIVTFFVYGTVVNGLLSAIAPPLLPGWIHALFFSALLLGTALVVVRDDSEGRRLFVLALMLCQLLFGALVAMTRFHGGVTYASSYRYVYVNMWFQLPLVAALTGIAVRWARKAGWAERSCGGPALAIGSLLLGLALYGGFAGRRQWSSDEQRRCDCLQEVLGGDGPVACMTSIYYRSDPGFVKSAFQRIPNSASRWTPCLPAPRVLVWSP